MKTIKFIKTNLFILFILISSSMFAQTVHDPNNTPFVGTWQYQNGDTIFKLIIWEDQMPNPYNNKYYLHGNYEMLAIINNAIVPVYTSNSYKSPDFRSICSAFSGIVYMKTDGTKLFGGNLREIHKGGTGYNGDFSIIQLPPCSGCPEKISWKVVKSKGMQTYIGDTPPADFVIPNNIELTKVL